MAREACFLMCFLGDLVWDRFLIFLSCLDFENRFGDFFVVDFIKLKY